MRLPEKLEFVQSVQNPTSEDISFFISILADPDENELLQTAALRTLKRCGEAAASSLTSLFYSEKSSDSASVVRISYALSQIPETSSSVLIDFLSDDHPRVRQNGVIGLSLQNDGEFDLLLFSVLQNDPDPKTAYEAAEALELGGTRTLFLFKTVILRDLKHNPYIASEKKSEAVHKIQLMDAVSDTFSDTVSASASASASAAASAAASAFASAAVSKKTEETFPAFSDRLTDDHVLWKILEILGNTQKPEFLPYIEPYLFHENPRIKNSVEMLIQNFEK